MSWEAKGSVDDLRVKSKEVLCNLAGTRVLRVQRCHKCRWLAVVVELVVNGTLGKDCALECVEESCDFWVFLGSDKSVLQNETKLEILAFNKGEEFSGPRVHVRSVDATGLKETDGGADTETGKDGEGCNILEGELVRLV